MRISTKFNLYDRVKIIPLDNMEGRITEICILEKGMKYGVRYFYECKIHEIYFYEDELIKDKKLKEEENV